MNQFEKLFLHLFTHGIERYGDSKRVLKEVDDILGSHDDVLWESLAEGFRQAHRLRVLKKHGISMEIWDPIDPDISEDILDEIFDDNIDVSKLRKHLTSEMQKRWKPITEKE